MGLVVLGPTEEAIDGVRVGTTVDGCVLGQTHGDVVGGVVGFMPTASVG